MSKVQFQVRIDEKIQQDINSYIAYINAITGMFISLGDLNRAIVEEGIKSLIEKKGGLEYINKIAVEDADEFYQEFKKEMEEK